VLVFKPRQLVDPFVVIYITFKDKVPAAVTVYWFQERISTSAAAVQLLCFPQQHP
jgi:hypothetical protein